MKNYTKNDNINSMQTKKQLINYIIKNVQLSKFNYKIIKFREDLELLKGDSYYITPNYNGINSLMIFTKFKNNYYSLIIDKRKNINDINNVKIIPIDIRLNKSIYDGTILDGVLLYNNNNNKKSKTFVVNDIYCFCGENYIDANVKDKLANFAVFIKNSFKDDYHMNSCTFIINSFYNCSQIKKLINIYIPESSHRKSIKGISFFPERSGTRLIYLYSNSISQKNADNNEHSKISAIVIQGDVKATFKIKQTDNVDVYYLFMIKKIKRDNKKVIKYVTFNDNLKLAKLPSIETSLFCKKLFESGNKNILVKCKFVKGGWVPYKVINKKYPDTVKHVNSLLGIN